MTHPETPVSCDESTGYQPLEDTSTQTDGNLFILVDTRDANTQTAAEESISQGTTREASTQTPENDLSCLEHPPVTSEIYEESRMRKILDELEVVTHGSHVCKLPRTESSEVSDPLVLPAYTGNTEIIDPEQNDASNKNTSQKEKAPREKSDTGVSKVKNVGSVDDMLAVPDTSRCLENKPNSESSVEKLRNASRLKQKSPDQQQQTCLVCQRTNSEHVVKVPDGNDLCICCRCSSPYKNINYLQMHIYDEHLKPFYCYACRLMYSQNGAHRPRRRSNQSFFCNFCNQTFVCKYQLNEHFILFHKRFLETNCRICSKKLDEHFALSKEVQGNEYQCCVKECEKRTNSTISLNEHLNKHFGLKLFKCEVCGYQFMLNSDLEKHLQDIHPLCKLCKKRFVNIYFFNEHGCEQHTVE